VTGKKSSCQVFPPDRYNNPFDRDLKGEEIPVRMFEAVPVRMIYSTEK